MSGPELLFWVALAGWQILVSVIVLYSFTKGGDDE